MPKKICWILVNYHNTADIQKLVKRYISYSDFLVVDNSRDYVPVDTEDVVVSNGNIGYMGGFQLALKKFHKTYEKIIFSNSDIEIKEPGNLFKISELKKIQVPLIKTLDGIDQNPHFIQRPKKSYFLIRYFFSKNLIFWNFWNLIVNLKRKIFSNKKNISKIYSGHGSFIIFNNIDFTEFINMKFNFLYGEEIHIAEYARKLGIAMELDSSIKITHNEHSTTRKLNTKRKMKFFHQSYQQILKFYYT